MAQTSTFDLDLAGVDDLYFSALSDDEDKDDSDEVFSILDDPLFDDEDNGEVFFSILDDTLFDDEDKDEAFSILDDKYANELQFQETLMAPVINSYFASNRSVSSSIPPFKEAVEDSKTEQKEHFPTEAGESSSSSLSQIICEICVEVKQNDEMFKNQRCEHSFCSECITKQVATKIQEGMSIVSCPGLDCNGVLELDACRPMLPKDLLDRWDAALCEALFVAAPKFYCPFKDCSAMLLLDEGGGGDEGGILIRESECPVCHRLFCARCSVPWHPGVECEEFQRMEENERGRDDLLVRHLSNEQKWRRCPRCKFYVEKTEGCPHMTCRCQFQFCYRCGEPWTSTHDGCREMDR